MEQYISKSTLVTEIKRKINEINLSTIEDWRYRLQRVSNAEVMKNILSLIDTLEVKEINLEDSIKETLAQKYIDYICKRHNIDPDSREGQLIYYAYMHGINHCLNQLRIQKGE